MRRTICLLAALLAACASYEAPPPELREMLEDRATLPGPYVRQSAVVRIDSPHLSGTFDARLVARTRPPVQVRLQLFPEVGGKVLDLIAAPDRIQGTFPQAGIDYDRDLTRPEAPEPHLLLFFGITLLENFTPIAERLEAVQLTQRGWDLRLEPPVARAHVAAAIDPLGALLARYYAAGSATWIEVLEGERHAIEAPGFRLEIRDLETEVARELPDDVFTPGTP